MVDFSRVESFTASRFFYKIHEGLFQRIFQEKTSAKVYSGKINESTPRENFHPVNFPNKLTVNNLSKFKNACVTGGYNEINTYTFLGYTFPCP